MTCFSFSFSFLFLFFDKLQFHSVSDSTCKNPRRRALHTYFPVCTGSGEGGREGGHVGTKLTKAKSIFLELKADYIYIYTLCSSILHIYCTYVLITVFLGNILLYIYVSTYNLFPFCCILRTSTYHLVQRHYLMY